MNRDIKQKPKKSKQFFQYPPQQQKEATSLNHAECGRADHSLEQQIAFTTTAYINSYIQRRSTILEP